MDMEKKLNLEIYEYKRPSYRFRKRKKNFTIDGEQCKRESRYTFDGTMYVSKDAQPKEEISILMAGDLLCQENLLRCYHVDGDDYDFSLCFDYIRPILKGADFSVGNLETPISDRAPYRGEILTHEGPFYCNAPIEYMDALQYAGFDMLTTANNHTLDAGVHGLCQTILNARKFGFIQTGTFYEKTDKFVIVNICGFKVGFTAFGTTYNTMTGNLTKEGKETLLNTYSKTDAEKIYQAMKQQGAEFMICLPHWGKEFTKVISKKQREMAETLTEIGYDAVIGSHSHVVQKMEVINGKPVVFSLGNLLTHLNVSGGWLDTQYPVLCNIRLKRENETIRSEIDFIPCRILKDLDGIPYTILPCNEHLKISDKIKEELKEVPQKVATLLCSDETVLNLNYSVPEQEIETLEKAKRQQKERVQRIEGINAMEEVFNTIDEKEAQEFFRSGFRKKNPDDYDVQKRGIFRVYTDHAELVKYSSISPVTKINEKIQGLPVTCINNAGGPNDSARIIYLGKHTQIVGKSAFQEFRKLESVRIFEGLREIDKQAFEGCISLTGINLPKTMEFIGAKAFAGCKNLLNIKIPAGVQQIGRKAFEGCRDLTIYCKKNSYAEKYAKANNIHIKYIP